MYRLFANIEYKNGDFERKILNDYTHLKDGQDMLKLHQHHWRDSGCNYQGVEDMTFDLLEVE